MQEAVVSLTQAPLASASRQCSNVRIWRISLKKAAVGNWHEGDALIHSGR